MTYSSLENIELILGGITPGRTNCDNMTRNVVHMCNELGGGSGANITKQ